MPNRVRRERRWLIAALILSLFAGTLSLSPCAQTGSVTDPQPGHESDGLNFKRKEWDPEKLARELWLWHELNRQRLARARGVDATEIENTVINNDINDVSVLQGDESVITPVNLFDLNGRAVLFTPAGVGYTISNPAAAFDSNLGTKLDLTVAPAVNPKADAEPGDDAYILQSLGFDFNFYGTSYGSVAVSSNGFLTFRPAGASDAFFNNDSVDSGESLSDLQANLPRIAAYWHDLDVRSASAQGNNGIFFRRDSDRVLVTWNNVPDFPNSPSIPVGVHRFQLTLFSDGRILFTYATAQLTQTALAGISPGNSTQFPSLADLDNPPASTFSGPVAEFFSTNVMVDVLGTVRAFYATHPNRDVYDFIYLVTDFNFTLGGNAFAFYSPVRNPTGGIGQSAFDRDPDAKLGGRQIQGILNLSNITEQYPDLPTTRFLGANHALSIMGQEQGHRWLAYVQYPGADPKLLLGRQDAHWNFFLNIEATISNAAAPRSSSAEGSVWRETSPGSFTSVNLIDGYSRLDQYLMGFRPATDVPDTFVITNPTNTGGRTRASGPRPNVTLNGTRQTITIDQIIQANGPRTPDVASAQKDFRAAVVLLVRQGVQPSALTLNKVTRYRLAWESYFAQSTDYRASVNTGLADQTGSRTIAVVSAASYGATLAPAEITALFGQGLTAGGTEVATSQPLPTTLAGTQVLVNGVPAPLFFASPGQINFEVPRFTAATTTAFSPPVQSGTAMIEVTSNGQLIRAGAPQVAPAVPAVFTFNQSGTGPAVAIDALTFTLPPFDAKRATGEPNIITLFGTGLGSDATDTGGDVASSVQAMIDNNAATVTYAGPAPGFTGLNQLNVVLPANITSGTHTLVVARNGVASNPVTIAIK